MANTGLKQEDYAAIADFMLQSFERDKADFLTYYKSMDDAYLAEFKAANEALKNAPSVTVRTKQQKSITTQLYTLLDNTKRNIIFLKDYAQRVELDVTSLAKAVKQIASRNAEGTVKILRDILPYYEEHTAEITNMPEGFIAAIQEQITQIETLNASQNNSINVKNDVANSNLNYYKTLYKYISEVAKAGKLIYKGTAKEGEYTIQTVLSRVRVAKKSTASTTTTTIDSETSK